jgi:hypothetical protein
VIKWGRFQNESLPANRCQTFQRNCCPGDEILSVPTYEAHLLERLGAIRVSPFSSGQGFSARIVTCASRCSNAAVA